ncbi:flagellar basal body rod protein FlgB [Paenibacillus sp. NEAU-GSW1]|uniref:flagellar basal body rod protein FlgB n=1 Tax=Paenibacillus sp. NEAU-GSW1 TaxID=2682486 RepID=UPI0012E1E6A8|nr:flagellar basal body rod protein FlgB [Paenibacillus sp. NEAU-GSW1]MUT66347.1 flagellar basal body rod protein FlgB [Paenibacillus sp. NEAU-GSW1]
MKLLSGASFQRLESAVHAAEMRQGVLANNIANADTPNFKRSEVLFEELLEQQMGQQPERKLVGLRNNERHLHIGKTSAAASTTQISTDSATTMNNNGNNVDIEREMALLAKNQLSYNFYIQQINHDAKMMRIGIEGRA